MHDDVALGPIVARGSCITGLSSHGRSPGRGSRSVSRPAPSMSPRRGHRLSKRHLENASFRSHSGRPAGADRRPRPPRCRAARGIVTASCRNGLVPQRPPAAAPPAPWCSPGVCGKQLERLCPFTRVCPFIRVRGGARLTGASSRQTTLTNIRKCFSKGDPATGKLWYITRWREHTSSPRWPLTQVRAGPGIRRREDKTRSAPKMLDAVH